MRLIVWLLLAAITPLLSLDISRADGTLPPMPYRYLHPPAALAHGNLPPVATLRVLPADYLRSVQTLALFTPDTQAGISGGKGAFHVDAGTAAVAIRITPVAAPAGLPQEVAADGNAYFLQAREQPSHRDARLVAPLLLTLRFPHLPIAIYTYRGGAWKQLCYENVAVLTSSTFGCKIRQLGLFVAVTPPVYLQVPNTPSTPLHQLNRYIPALAAVLLIIVAAMLGWYVSRPDSRKSRGSRR